MKSYHLTQEQISQLLEAKGYHGESFKLVPKITDIVNAALTQVLGEPVGEVEVRKQRVLLDTFQQVTSPIQDGRHKLYAPKEQS